MMLKFYCIFVFCAVLFVSEFFPIPTTYHSENNIPEYVQNVHIGEVYKPDITKTVLVVIDALRLDFVTPEYMPYTTSLANNYGCLNNVTVQIPTVTMPRIKALTTGNVPQYLDIVKNLAVSENVSNSWLHSAKDKKNKIVFYGDDTWMRLFPDIFTRSEGTTSFFVNDFEEVDNNVTRNLHKELKQKDFDIMILHYLGLDHIGHVFGPYSRLVGEKLKQMDTIIEKIYTSIVSDNQDSIILITGDHGMRDSGGHGGSSFAETIVPLVALGVPCESSSMQQTDIPANLAVLLGLKIPSASIGKLNSKFLKKLSYEKYLYALRYNTHILLQKKNVCRKDFEQATNLHLEYLKKSNLSSGFLASQLYSDCTQDIIEILFKQTIRRDLPSLVSYIIIMLSILSILVCHIIAKNVTVPYTVISIVALIVLTRVFSLAVIFSFIYFCKIVHQFYHKNIIGNFKMMSLDKGVILIILACVIQPFTLFSSSFVEEEHQYWYFLLNIFNIIAIVGIVKDCKIQGNKLLLAKLFLILILFRFIRRINSIGDKWSSHPDISDWFLQNENFLIYNLYYIFGLTMVWHLINSNSWCHKLINSVIFLCIFILKTANIHTVALGKLIWALIVINKLLFKTSWKHCIILIITLLLKPYNIVLIPFFIFLRAVYKQALSLENTKLDEMTVVHILLGNCLYFAQGHCNSLASVDVSSGYIGLEDYNPFLVMTQVNLHTFAFPIICDFLVLSEVVNTERYFLILFIQKAFVVIITCIVTVLNKEHLFIWSVFAPKLIIESVHIGFLLVRICIYYGIKFVMSNFNGNKYKL